MRGGGVQPLAAAAPSPFCSYLRLDMSATLRKPSPPVPDSWSSIQAPQALESGSSWFTAPPPQILPDKANSLPFGPSGGPPGPPEPPSSGPSGPDPDTGLDPDETNVGCVSSYISGIEHARRSDLNQSFRHSFWQDRRHSTLSAFRDLDLSPSRIDRYCGCGSVSWVLRQKESDGVFRVATNGCRDRWCEACSSEKRRTIVRNVRDKLDGLELRFLTLTLKSRPDSLDSQLTRLFKCFRAFRQRSRIKRCMKGGLYFVELTVNEQNGLWHPHLHVLFVGDYLPKRVASDTWLSCTGDSFIVDLARVQDASHAAGYIAKYAGKAIPKSVWNSPVHLHEAILALAGRRLFSYFGSFKGLELSKNPADDVGWDTIAPLFTVIDLARRGDPYCRSIIAFLKGGQSYESAELSDSS